MGNGAEVCEVERPASPESERVRDTAWLAKNSFATLGGALTGRVLQGGIQITLARLLGPATFGLYTIGWAMLRVANVVAPLGLNNGVIHCATRYATSDLRQLGRVLRDSLALAMLFGALMGLAMCIAAPALAHKVYKKEELLPLIWLFAAGVPLAAGLVVASASTKISQSLKYSVYAESLVQPGVNLALVICFYLVGWRLLGAAAAVVISFGIGLSVALIYRRRLFPGVRLWTGLQSTSKARGLMQFSLLAWLGVTCVNLVPLVDRLAVGVYLTPAAVGVYQAAAQSSVLLGIIGGAFNAVVAPRISMLYQSSQIERLEHVYRVSTKWALYTSIPLLLVFCFAPEQVLRVLYGKNYTSAVQPLIILSSMWLIDIIAGPAGMVLIFTARRRLFSFIAASELVLCLALSYVLIPYFGAVGAALAVSLASTALMLTFVVAVRATLGIWPCDWRWFKGIVATGATVVALVIARRLDVEPAVLGLLLQLALATAVFASILLWLGLDSEDREMIRTLKSKLVALAQAAEGG